LQRIVVTRADHGRTIDLPVQCTLEIRLPEHPSTLYPWAAYHNDRNLLSRSRQKFFFDRSKDGVGGNRILGFPAGNAGSTTLRFKLFWAWEGDGSIIDRLELTLNID
jgi:predicted secreted protein